MYCKRRLSEVQSQDVVYGPGDAMKVFLSWSGELSRHIALALRDWLPKVIQAIEPWMSSEDIEKGARWSSEIAKELNSTKAGIVCVTPDNQNAPWLNFEAGALSKTVEKEMVCPYLFQLKSSDLTGPLVQFQAAEASKPDTQRLLSTLNRALTPKPLSDVMLSETFENWWGKFETRLQEIGLASPAVRVHRSPADMIEEVLDIVRQQARTTQLVLSTVQQALTEGIQNRSVLDSFRLQQRPLSNFDLLLDHARTSPSTHGITGSLPLGTTIRDYDPPTEETVGFDGHPIDLESPQRDE